IEITGLTKAFGETEKQFCAIGSIKSNVGHLEGAAGIVGVTKVLLQMKYQQLVPSIHSNTLNSHIAFEQTPFYVQRELSAWRPRPDYPRRASVSSFGAMGTNAYLILEEYIEPAREETKLEGSTLVLLSAKNVERLTDYAQQLLQFVEDHPNINLADLAYTLQVGREAMEERLGIIVTSTGELQNKLKKYLDGDQGIEEFYQGKQSKESLVSFVIDEAMAKTIETWIERRKYTKLLELWVRGLNVDWEMIYRDIAPEKKPRKISAPTYPFARERYWISAHSESLSKLNLKTVLHPLLHENTSTLSEQRFCSTFTGDEFFLKDHMLKSHKILPGVTYLEMVNQAIHEAFDDFDSSSQAIQIKNVVWARPILVDENTIVSISLYPEKNNSIAYEITTKKEDELIIHSYGIANFVHFDKIKHIDIATLKSRCYDEPITITEIYDHIDSLGLHFGESFRALNQVFMNPMRNEVVARLQLPTCVTHSFRDFNLHPSLLDATFVTTAIIHVLHIKQDDEESLSIQLPYALDEITILKSFTPIMWVWTRMSSSNASNIKKFDIDLYDENGDICVQLHGLTFLEANSEKTNQTHIGALVM
ncbi:MAG: type I polyketide synthase, partial [Gammaproteobacteria bacterium]|nr:type I polyketide synthase [Gammaproteobacteria bacterium]